MKIEAFRGYRYTRRRSRDLTEVVAPPYDQISQEMQDTLYAMSPDNIVRVTYAKDEPTGDRYARAREVLAGWLGTGVLTRDEQPTLYPYHQTYRAQGRLVRRRGFIALGEVSDYARGVVLPHERTHAEPKLDRLKLLEATAADTGLLFMLVSDPSGDLLKATEPSGEPIAEARDLRGEWHGLWSITDPAVIQTVQTLMAPRPVIIADGHHRYETAVDYARRHPAAARKLMAFFTLEAPGLTILANHRLVHGGSGLSLARLTTAAEPWFEAMRLDDPLAFEPSRHRIGVVMKDAAAVFTVRRDAMGRISWPAATSDAWRDLAVAILHEGLLKPLFGITDADLDARTRVDYTADQGEAVRLVRDGRFQAAFLIAPTTPEELLTIVSGGEVLPQKSTHFYPKLLDGLVFHRLEESADD